MNMYVMLTKLLPRALDTLAAVENRSRQVNERIKCSRVRWLSNYAISGPWRLCRHFRGS